MKPTNARLESVLRPPEAKGCEARVLEVQVLRLLVTCSPTSAGAEIGSRLRRGIQEHRESGEIYRNDTRDGFIIET